MDIKQIILGFSVSMFGGALILWLVVDKILWGYLVRKEIVKSKRELNLAFLTPLLGIIERSLYTTALIIKAPEWVAVWLAMKVAVTWHQWQGKERAPYNVFLIGNALSVIFGLVGAWIALGHLPSFT